MFLNAVPFTLSLVFLPLAVTGLMWGGVWIFAVPLYAFLTIPVLDKVVGLNTDDLDPTVQDAALFWHRLITWVWVPVQFSMIFGLIWVAGSTDRLSMFEAIAMAIAVGIATGGVGITYAHELMHQRNKFEKALAEVLMTSTLYGHFCIEHVYGHHKNVGTPKDPASARYQETIYQFLPRTLIGGFVSAWEIQTEIMQRKSIPPVSLKNPFVRYLLATLVYFAAAYGLAGFFGIGLFVVQAVMAVLLLETINYIEHYGLSRRRLDNGKFERVQPHHSWNAAQRISNYLLINLQRHSDHHFRPGRRFPLLQNFSDDEAPQLPYGYATMALMASVPPLWFKVMNPKVEAWRSRYQGVST